MIWLIGAQDMLGREIAGLLTQQALPFIGTDLEVDITDPAAIRRFAADKNFAWIINCAAYTAVDKAEAEPDKAFAVNGRGPGLLAKLARELDANLVHFSTDYVFDGRATTPYDEEAQTGPLSVYGKSKLDGELQLRRHGEKYFLFRISWLYGVHGPNFVRTMLRLFREREELKIVNDQVGAPTYAGQLAKNIVRLVTAGGPAEFGVYHYADEGELSWFEFATEIRKQAIASQWPVKTERLLPIPTEWYPTPATRPKNSRFNKTKVRERLQFEMLDWRANLKHFFAIMPKDKL